MHVASDFNCLVNVRNDRVEVLLALGATEDAISWHSTFFVVKGKEVAQVLVGVVTIVNGEHEAVFVVLNRSVEGAIIG